MKCFPNALRAPVLWALVFFWSAGGSWGEVLVTEFMADNAGVLEDGDGDTPDWVELFNSGSETVALGGYSLTDDPGALGKWAFPAGVELTPSEFLVVFASGKNRAVAGEELHTNFSLARDGDYLALVAPDGETVLSSYGAGEPPVYVEQFEDVSYGRHQTGDTTPRVMVTSGAPCRVLVPTSDIGRGWTERGFDDGGWDAATTGIGYENGNGYQALFGTGGDVGTEMSGITSSVYIRIPFPLTDAGAISELTLKMKYDDGFIAYLNGVRVADGNGPAVGEFDSEATSDHPDGEAVEFEDTDITAFAHLLVAGENVLAIHGLNGDSGSSDLLILPELHAVEFSNPEIGDAGYLARPTPGALNGQTFGGFVSDTKFSIGRGFFDAPIDVEITTATEGATIRYTTDGSWPSETQGTVYTGPVRIDRTTPLRAIATKAGAVPTNVDTQTYIFVDDVVEQDAAFTTGEAGFPTSWDGQAPDYGMDPRVVDDAQHRQTIRDDLKVVPSLSIAMDSDDLFGSRGIYSHPGSSGSAWERATSFELIDPANPDGSNDFQLNCGIRIQGGAFRSFGLTRKKSLRLLFKGEYGPTKLRYPMFGTDNGAVEAFDTLTLRMESNDGYQWGNRTNVQYARDEFGRRTQRAMGRPGAHGRFMHVYLNGVYWGVYNVVERPDASFGAAYFGADKGNWDGINSGRATNEGSTGPWNTMMGLVDDITAAGSEAERTAALMRAQGRRPDGSDDPALEDYIDIDNYIDYLLVNWYLGNNDWPHKNYYCGRERGPGSEGFKFFMWDSEWSMFMNSSDDKTGTFSGIAGPQQHLRNSLEYRLRFADRAQRALFNGGALTAAACMERYDDLTAQHTRLLVPELARWGDQHGTLRTIGQWQSEASRIKSSWIAERSGLGGSRSLVEVLQGADLYPDVLAPAFNRHGGSVSPGTPVTMATGADKIYYTTDGSDPRLLGGAVRGGALEVSFGDGGPGGPVPMTFVDTGHVWRYLDDGSDQGTAWRDVGFNDGGWEEGASELGYGDDGEGSGTQVEFGPDSGAKFATTYFRTGVVIGEPDQYDHFLLQLKYDDAAAVYVNGTEVVRTANLAVGAAFDDYASGTVSSEGSFKRFTVPTARFRDGSNTIAVEVHQASGGSSDMRMDLILSGEVGPIGGGDNVSDPIFFAQPTEVKARAFDSRTGDWSALVEAFFTIDTEPANATNLLISEIHYHPDEPTSPAEVAVSGNRDDYEFLELLNVGVQTVDLSGVKFLDGVAFEFADRELLGSGERLLVVRDTVAFRARYGDAARVAGEYGGRLDNDGERLWLVDAGGGTIVDVVYNDAAPWPQEADGDGASLVLKDESAVAGGDYADVALWGASAGTGGSPGASGGVFEGLRFGEWAVQEGVVEATGDGDGDGMNAVMEFGFGSSPNDAGEAHWPRLAVVDDGGGGERAVLLVRRRQGTVGLTLRVEVATDLGAWSDGAGLVEELGVEDHGDGTETVSYGLTGGGSAAFLRVVLQLVE